MKRDSFKNILWIGLDRRIVQSKVLVSKWRTECSTLPSFRIAPSNVSPVVFPQDQVQYLKSAERTRDPVYMLVKLTSGVCCRDPVRILMFSRSVWICP